MEAYGDDVRKAIGHKLGSYSLQEKRWSSGKPVFQKDKKNETEKDWYLLVPNRYTIWVIRSSITKKRARNWVASGRATNLPTDVKAGPRPDKDVEQWRYFDGRRYKEGNISITCSQ